MLCKFRKQAKPQRAIHTVYSNLSSEVSTARCPSRFRCVGITKTLKPNTFFRQAIASEQFLAENKFFRFSPLGNQARASSFLSAGLMSLANIPATGAEDASAKNLKPLDSIQFDATVLRELDVDETPSNDVAEAVPGYFFSRVNLIPVEDPSIVAISSKALELLNIDGSSLPEDAEEYLCGNKQLKGSEPAAHCYCGHQFGYFSGQLGDGAAMYLGDVANGHGERWELHLKGSGMTPYSRSADGRKVLRSSLREFLCSEAMHFLGIPTTRAGSVVKSKTKVLRDQFYNGNATYEPATVITRISPTFLRFGSFEIFKPKDPMTQRAGPSANLPNKEDLRKKLLEYVMRSHYPHVWNLERQPEESSEAYDIRRRSKFFAEVVERTAKLVALWQCYGFCHGVLNTDNMSIIGLTLDYGPFGFMEHFDPNYICNTSDHEGRYSYKKQPEMCKWNCSVLADQLEPLIPRDALTTALDQFDNIFKSAYLGKMRSKLGLAALEAKEKEDRQLVQDLFDVMEISATDFSATFRLLSQIKLPPMSQLVEQITSEECISSVISTDWYSDIIDKLLQQTLPLCTLRSRYRPRIHPKQLEALLQLAQTKPEQLAELGGNIELLLEEVERVKKFQELGSMEDEAKLERDRKLWSEWMEKYLHRALSEVVPIIKKEVQPGETIQQLDSWAETRLQQMKSNNPAFVLRNFVAQLAIDAAQEGNTEEVAQVLRALESPYGEDYSTFLPEKYHYRPSWADRLQVSCSS